MRNGTLGVVPFDLPRNIERNAFADLCFSDRERPITNERELLLLLAHGCQVEATVTRFEDFMVDKLKDKAKDKVLADLLSAH